MAFVEFTVYKSVSSQQEKTKIEKMDIDSVWGWFLLEVSKWSMHLIDILWLLNNSSVINSAENWFCLQQC